MSVYLSALFLKARTDLDVFVRKFDLSASDIGFYYVLMSVSKRDLTDGLLSMKEVSKEARNVHLRGWKKCIEKLLEAGLITEITDAGIQLDWRGQTTREAVEKRSVTRADGTHDVGKMHENGDHTYCRKPHCDTATQWAKRYDENGVKRVTQKVTGKGYGSDPTGDHPQVTQSHNQIQRQKDSGFGDDEAAAPTLTPGGDAPYSPPEKDALPVADDEDYTPPTPRTERTWVI